LSRATRRHIFGRAVDWSTTNSPRGQEGGNMIKIALEITDTDSETAFSAGYRLTTAGKDARKFMSERFGVKKWKRDHFHEVSPYRGQYAIVVLPEAEAKEKMAGLTGELYSWHINGDEMFDAIVTFCQQK